MSVPGCLGQRCGIGAGDSQLHLLVLGKLWGLSPARAEGEVTLPGHRSPQLWVLLEVSWHQFGGDEPPGTDRSLRRKRRGRGILRERAGIQPECESAAGGAGECSGERGWRGARGWSWGLWCSHLPVTQPVTSGPSSPCLNLGPFVVMPEASMRHDLPGCDCPCPACSAWLLGAQPPQPLPEESLPTCLVPWDWAL